MLAQRRRLWPIITSALRQCNVLSGKRHPHIVMRQSANTGQSHNAVSISDQRRRRWANIETVLGDSQCLLGRADAKYTDDPVLECCWASVVDNLSALDQQWAATLALH